MTLSNHLSTPPNERNEAWRAQLYKLAPTARYQFMSMGTGPDGHKYIFAQLLDEAATGGDNLAKFAQFASEEITGMAIFTDPKKQPDITLRFGALWAFKEYKRLEGAPQLVSHYERAFTINPQDPFSAKVSNTNQVQLGQPSEQFLPMYVRNAMTAAIMHIIPDAKPQLAIYEQKDFALSLNIVVSAGRQLTYEEHMRLGQEMTWYLPPYLPAVVAANAPAQQK